MSKKIKRAGGKDSREGWMVSPDLLRKVVECLREDGSRHAIYPLYLDMEEVEGVIVSLVDFGYLDLEEEERAVKSEGSSNDMSIDEYRKQCYGRGVNIGLVSKDFPVEESYLLQAILTGTPAMFMKRRRLMSGKYDLSDIAHELKTQDNRLTENPLFCVFEKERVYGIDPSFSDYYDLDERGKKVYYVERDMFVSAHFTAKAAEKYIKENKHNLEQPFLYVSSMHRCPEMIAIRKALMDGRVKPEEEETDE